MCQEVGCFLFCASTPRRSTHLHTAERELEVQRARCQGHGRRLHAAHASQPALHPEPRSSSKHQAAAAVPPAQQRLHQQHLQHLQQQQSNRPLLPAHWDAIRRPTT